MGLTEGESRPAYTPEDRAALLSSIMTWIGDPAIIAAIMTSGVLSWPDMGEMAVSARAEADRPGTVGDEWFDQIGWALLRREEVRAVIAQRIGATYEGVTVAEARKELKRLRDRFLAARDARFALPSQRQGSQQLDEGEEHHGDPDGALPEGRGDGADKRGEGEE